MSRLDWRYELEGIGRGIRKDLQEQVGQTVLWYVFDAQDSVVDDIYDVGAIPSGRVWFPPVYLPVASAIKFEAEEVANDRGFYTVDTLRLVFSVDAAARAGLGGLVLRPDEHDIDRVVYENKVFAVDQIRVRGILTAGYAVVGIDAKQVKSEELVNDPQFQAFIPRDDG